MTAISASLLYIALNLLILVFLAVRVVGVRMSKKISLGTGGDSDLEQRVRAHGNASEYAPLMLIGLYALAANGASASAIHLLGGAFTLGRIAHAIGMSGGPLAARQIGMMLTWLPMIGAAGLLLYTVFA